MEPDFIPLFMSPDICEDNSGLLASHLVCQKKSSHLLSFETPQLMTCPFTRQKALQTPEGGFFAREGFPPPRLADLFS